MGCGLQIELRCHATHQCFQCVNQSFKGWSPCPGCGDGHCDFSDQRDEDWPRVGEIVQVRSWADMKHEFGVDNDGDIYIADSRDYWFPAHMKYLCEKHLSVVAKDAYGDFMLSGAVGFLFIRRMVQQTNLLESAEIRAEIQIAAPEESFVHSTPGMYKMYTGPRIGHFRDSKEGRGGRSLYRSCTIPVEDD